MTPKFEGTINTIAFHPDHGEGKVIDINDGLYYIRFLNGVTKWFFNCEIYNSPSEY